MSLQLTPKMSSRARSLLKWNVNDLAKASNVQPKTIESFERGIKRLIKPDNDAMFKIFKEHGIRFKDNMEIELVEIKSGKRAGGTVRPNIKIKEETYDAEDMAALVSQYFAAKEAQDSNR